MKSVARCLDKYGLPQKAVTSVLRPDSFAGALVQFIATSLKQFNFVHTDYAKSNNPVGQLSHDAELRR